LGEGCPLGQTLSPIQYMLYFIQDGTGAYVQIGATQVINGVATSLTASQVSQKPLTQWTSPATGLVYPTSWQITVTGGSLTVKSLFQAQEFVGAPGYSSYYEGDSSVSGELYGLPVSGVAFAEINPYNEARSLLP
jgi:predicted secreted hydrolase